MKHLFCIFTIVAFSCVHLISSDAHWPMFRGPQGDGIAQNAQLPTSWSDESNIVWKIDIHDRGWSSPVVYGDQIWLTTATEDGTKLYGMCIDAVSGRTLFDELLFEIDEPQFAHKFNSYASPSPIVEGDHVYLTFGSPGTACIHRQTFDIVWTRDDIECDHFRGAGSSPIIYENLLIMHFDGADHQFVMALDKSNGENVWSTKRSVDFKDLDQNGKPSRDGDFRKAYSTPYLFSEKGGKKVIASLGSKAGYGYDPKNGHELWRIDEPSAHSGTGMPVVGNDKIYYVTGFAKGTLYSIQAGSRGVLDKSDMVWKTKRNVSNKPSPIFYNGYIFMVDDGGIASCLDAQSGEEQWRERVGGNHSASPLISNGLIYFFNEEGICSILEAAPQYKEVGKNKLGSGFMASPAIYKHDLILRSKTHLYRISK